MQRVQDNTLHLSPAGYESYEMVELLGTDPQVFARLEEHPALETD